MGHFGMSGVGENRGRVDPSLRNVEYARIGTADGQRPPFKRDSRFQRPPFKGDSRGT